MGSMSKFSGHIATTALTDEAQVYMKACEAWLLKNEPEFFAMKGPGQVIDTALQGLGNAEALRCKNDGRAMVEAYAYAIGRLLQQQRDPQVAWQDFAQKVNAAYNEIATDMTPKGSC